MGRHSVRLFSIAMPILLSALPASTAAQTNGSIAGVVRDASGAVLPGVTIEASSPALIERVRTVVTDGEGQYKIIDLRPGAYTVTFALPGFSTIRREGIELTASFTATVNAELRVGALEETITVSGAAPTVDVQNVVQQKVMTRDIIDSVPLGNKNTASIGVLIPGVVTSSQDVGGVVFGSAAIAIHGGRTGEMQGLFDGIYFNNGFGVGGSFMSIALNDQTFQEMSLETGGTSAESWMGGIRTNAIPKDGGNTFKGSFFGAYTNDHLQSRNLDGELQARGLATVDQVLNVWDFAPAFGGPLVRNKLWFFGSWRAWSVKNQLAGQFYNLSTRPHVFTADPNRPAIETDLDRNTSLRLTWQVSPRNKIAIHPQYNTGDRNPDYNNSRPNTNPDATPHYLVRPSGFGLVTWSSPVTSRLLLEAGSAFAAKDFQRWPHEGIGQEPYSYRELSTNFAWGNITGTFGNNHGYNWIQRFAVSYVTGSHAAKVGVNLQHSSSWSKQDVTGPNKMTLALLNGQPRQVTVYAMPLELREMTKYNLGVFAQDQWTVKRLTLNLGVRYDHLNSYVPAQHVGPGVWTPDRNVDFPRIDNVPDWKNVSPRFGVAYDLFGNGRTAVKATLGKYLESPNQGTYTRRVNPLNAIAVNATRTWTDSNGDFLPQLNELGALNNVNFGNSVITTVVADEVHTNRGYNWESSASIQHELITGVSVNVAYFRRSYGNQTATRNTAVSAADFSHYCVTAPLDSRLPNGGGYEVCGFYDVSPTKFGRTANVVSLASNFGKAEEVYDGVDFNMNARMSRGIAVSGGASIGRVRTNTCYATTDPSISFAPATSGATSPRTSAFCNVHPPFQPNVKFLVVYPLPWWGLQTSGTYQGLPGQQITATMVATNAQIVPSLGRTLSSGAAGTVIVDLIPPGTLYTDRLNQVNFRVTKIFRTGRTGRRVQAMVDLYNLLNANSLLVINNAFNASWPGAISVLQGRLLKLGMQIDF